MYLKKIASSRAYKIFFQGSMLPAHSSLQNIVLRLNAILKVINYQFYDKDIDFISIITSQFIFFLINFIHNLLIRILTTQLSQCELYLNIYKFTIYSHMSLSNKRQQLLKQMRKKNRQEIRSNIREAIISKMNSSECPLISNVFADFIECTHWQLCQEQQRLSQIIQNSPLTELDEFQHQEFITDLYYLVHQGIITMPYGVQFKKDQSTYTATLVALTANQINQYELMYWINYMDPEARDAMFYAINVQDETHQRWVKNHNLYNFLLENVEWMESAATTFKDFLVLSQQITKKQIDQSYPYVESGIKRQIQSQRLKKNTNFLRILTQIWIKFIQIYSKLSIHAEKVKQMIQILKKIIKDDIDILLRNDIVQDLNQLYELIREDYIQDNQACEILLANSIRLQEMKNQDQFMLQNSQLFKNYLFRLFHNNWRAKQLTNRHFHYSTHFYDMLHKFNKIDKSNPYYLKLLSIQSNE